MFGKISTVTRIFTPNDLKFNTKLALALSITHNNHKSVGFIFFLWNVRWISKVCVSLSQILIKNLKWTSFFSRQAMHDFKPSWGKQYSRKKAQSLKEISFRPQTRLSFLAMRVTFKTNVKRFGYPSANLAVYNTGQQKKIL